VSPGVLDTSLPEKPDISCRLFSLSHAGCAWCVWQDARIMDETAPCGQCGGTVAPDGHCWDCGAAQVAFRAHLEIEADSGAAGVSDRGLRREINADAMALTTRGEWTIGVVCDGVSMAPRAERAARVAAEVGAGSLAGLLESGVLPEVALVEAAGRAGRAVAGLAQAGERHSVAPACTWVACVVGPEGMWSASVGDSRAYWLPDEGPGMTLTKDDTGDLDALTAWLGADADEAVPHVRSYRPGCPGRLLLCTDGLWRHLPDAAGLRTVVREAGPLPGARALVSYALEAGGRDNVTALLVPVAPARG
jgi:serine/threonine protein phosphatase PrpC